MQIPAATLASLPQDLRKARKAEEQQQRTEDAKQWRERSLQEGRSKVVKAAQQQHRKGGGSKGEQGADGAAGGQAQQQKQAKQQQQQQQQKGGGKQGKRQRDEEGGLAFNKLDFGSGAAHGRCGWQCWLRTYSPACCMQV